MHLSKLLVEAVGLYSDTKSSSMGSVPFLFLEHLERLEQRAQTLAPLEGKPNICAYLLGNLASFIDPGSDLHYSVLTCRDHEDVLKLVDEVSKTCATCQKLHAVPNKPAVGFPLAIAS